MDNESLVIYVIVVLCLGAVLIMSKDKMPPALEARDGIDRSHYDCAGFCLHYL